MSARFAARENTEVIADKERLLLKIFHDYYVRNMSQNEIASRHFISRQKVQRFLELGRNNNLVEVRIKTPERMHGALESELEDKYGLLEAIVADADEENNEAILKRNIAELASDYFIRILTNDMIVCVAWSRFIAEMAEVATRKIGNMREKPKNIRVIQTLGAIADNDPHMQTFDSGRRLAAALDGQLHLMLAPGITASVNAYHALMDDPQIANAVELAKRSQAAFFGIGTLRGESNLLNSLKRVMPEILPKLRRLGVVGDMNGHVFDRHGNPVASELDERLIGLNLHDIKRLPLTVGITSGALKFDALHAALVGKLIKVVVIDVDNARRLMAEGGGAARVRDSRHGAVS